MPLHADPPRGGPLAPLKRLFADFFRNAFGSDATVAYTAEYAWLANQMAHLTMGFFLGVVWPITVLAWGWSPWTVFLLFVFPPAKDAVDIAMDVWRGRSKNFAINYRELLLDSLTDDLYWWVGMAAGYAADGPWRGFEGRVAVTVIGLPVVLSLAFGLWVPQKRLFDFSRMPFNFVRLVKYPAPQSFLPPESMAALRAFQADVAESAGAKHYVLVGGRPVMRSGVAVSMGCEFISHWKGVYMISAVKVLEDPERLRRSCQMLKDAKKEVRCLIIDDLSVRLPVPTAASADEARQQRDAAPETDSPANRVADKLLHFVEVFDDLRVTFPGVSSVWVASGDVNNAVDSAKLGEWKQFIKRLAQAEELTTVTLTDPVPNGKDS